MAEYIPVYKPGQAITLKASATITGGQLVAISGSGTVAPSTADTVAWVGVAAFDAVTNDNVTIFAGGVQSLTASGSITAGATVEAAAAGAVATSSGGTAETIVGLALTSATNGNAVRVQFAR